MNIHESQFDELMNEQQFDQLGLTPEQTAAWIMVIITYILLIVPKVGIVPMFAT